MKLCKDCKYCKVSSYIDWPEYYCTYHTKTTINLITGEEEKYGTKYALKERYDNSEDHCGEEGKFWEPKED